MSAEPIIARPYQPAQAAEWKAFLGASNNGTLYHDLDFLSYHPAGRFDEHHLMFYQGAKLLALLPGAIVKQPDGRRFLVSPYGGSVGGLVMPPRLPSSLALVLVRTLQAYVKETGLDGMEMRIAPGVFQGQPNDLAGFSLMVNGFELSKCSLQYMIPLSKPAAELPAKLFSDVKQYDIRKGLKKGLLAREADVSHLGDFCGLLHDTYTRLRATPTHSDEELKDIFSRVPGRARLFLCAHEGVEIAGVLIFMLNAWTASSFYICSSSQHTKLGGLPVLIAHIAQQLAEEGLAFLDLGPSASESHFNEGVVFFKEGFGAQGFCRDTWRWDNKREVS